MGKDAFYVLGHDSRLGQVFNNLIDNALSFSPADGTVRVTLRRGRGEIEIVVDDDGPGIPPTLSSASSSASTPTGRTRASARIRASACRSRARSSRRIAGRSGREPARAAGADGEPRRLGARFSRAPAAARLSRRMREIHATCVVIGEAGDPDPRPLGSRQIDASRARCLRGAALAGRFGRLVATTASSSRRGTAALVARPVAPIAGMIEVRGAASSTRRIEPAAVVRLVVDCVAAARARLPEASESTPSLAGTSHSAAGLARPRRDLPSCVLWRLRVTLRTPD